MTSQCEAYLDIETTGLNPGQNDITVIGIYITTQETQRFVQLVGRKITKNAIMESVVGVSAIYTYNGHRFDLPFINARYDIDLEARLDHCDLMHHCWRQNLYGGLKAVERRLGIERKLKEVNGLEAVRLWWQYVDYADPSALNTLLEYNKEDVINLKFLKDRLFDRISK
jgi:uncharacterized protein